MAEHSGRTHREWARRWPVRAAGLLGLVGLLGACRLVGIDAKAGVSTSDHDVAAVAGWTRVATTDQYVIVVNVLPGESMYSQHQVDTMHPTDGELCLIGSGLPLGTNVRHVEAHIYDSTTGLPVSKAKPTIVVENRTTGERATVPATLMQDLIVGPLDVHWGNNVVIAGNSDLSVVVTIGKQEVTVDGHLA